MINSYKKMEAGSPLYTFLLYWGGDEGRQTASILVYISLCLLYICHISFQGLDYQHSFNGFIC